MQAMCLAWYPVQSKSPVSISNGHFYYPAWEQVEHGGYKLTMESNLGLSLNNAMTLSKLSHFTKI